MLFWQSLSPADEPDFNKTQRSTKSIKFYFNLLKLLEKICGRPSTPWAAWIYQIYATGGASGSTTMTMLFVMLFVFFVLSRLVIVTSCM
jgi:hypothetical protein